MVKVFTSRLQNYKGLDGLDITYKSNSIFSPTKKLVHGYKYWRISQEEYVKIFYELMRESYNNNYKEWQRILNLKSVVLLCYCPENSFCHRFLIKDMLVKLGAEYYGEI